jgi:hypothetical protein
MQPLQDVLTDQSNSSAVDSAFFSRPPMRSTSFILGTLLLLVGLACGCLILVRRWNVLSTIAIMQMGLAAVSMVILWFRAYRIFERLHELYLQAKQDPSFVRSPIDNVFRSAGNLMSATLFFGFSATAWFLIALGSALAHY